MTTHEHTAPRAVVAAVFDHINNHDLEGWKSLAADDVRQDWPIVGRLEGVSAVAEQFRALFDAFPDLHLEVLHTAAEGKHVFVHWRATGTFSHGEFNGIRATGRRIDLRGTDCFTIRDGKVVENFIAYDGLSFAIQAGVLPRHGTVADRVMTRAINVATRVRNQLRA
jgi:steroid delta-isomerase-like uncharacterized protein